MPYPTILKGSDSLAAAGLARILSECRTFQTECKALGAEDAKQFIFFKNAYGEPRPHAVISPGDSHGWSLIAGGAQNQLRPDGSVTLYMARDTELPYVDDNVAAEFEAANYFGSVVDEIAAQAGQDDKLSIINIRRVAFDENPEEEWQSTGGRFWFAVYLVTWGDG